MCKDSKIIKALHLKAGDIVALYGLTFQVVGKYEFFDSFGSHPQIFLIGCSNPYFISFLDPSERLYKSSSNIFVLYD